MVGLDLLRTRVKAVPSVSITILSVHGIYITLFYVVYGKFKTSKIGKKCCGTSSLQHSIKKCLDYSSFERIIDLN